jgi:cell division protein ZapE
MDLTPPDRFSDATFDSYRAQTPSQTEALEMTRRFVEEVRAPASIGDRVRELFGKPRRSGPQGLYLVGPVGTGKTHLLAATHHALTPGVSCAFLHSSTLFRLTEPPQDFAHRLADRHAVCCLDEVEIDDPANEARLVHVLQTLEARGVTLLATSNVEPEDFLSNKFGPDRFRRFLHEEFRARYRVLFVGGEDYRRRQNGQQRPGRGWIGNPEPAHAAMQMTFEETPEPKRWLAFDDLLTATTETAHDRLMARLTDLDALFVAGISITTTDDALRLLRVVDDLYLRPDAPALFFTASAPPEAWFDPDAHAGVAQSVAEKFTRTASRLHAMCDVQEMG